MLNIGGNIGLWNPIQAHINAKREEVIQREIDELFDAILEEEKEEARAAGYFRADNSRNSLSWSGVKI